jgi:hypothetical protein
MRFWNGLANFAHGLKMFSQGVLEIALRFFLRVAGRDASGNVGFDFLGREPAVWMRSSPSGVAWPAVALR